MTINIFMYHFGIKIEPGSKLFQYSAYTKDNNVERLQLFLEENIPKTCGMIKIYCDNNTLLNDILNIISYAHHIGAVLTVNTYDITKLKSINDWDKVNAGIKYTVNIVF